MISQIKSSSSLVTVDEEPVGGTHFKAWISVMLFTLMVWIKIKSKIGRSAL